jgi:Fur family peroxide stress response transcriptional regulator
MEELRSLGLTPTIQRVAVLKYLEETKTHPTAEQVLAAVREKYPTVSRATVYNTLEVLTKAGAILKLSIDSPAARYDADLSPHGHFRCRICGKIDDIQLPDIAWLQKRIVGHRVETVHAYAYGVCAACREEGLDSPPGRAELDATAEKGGASDAGAP